MPKPLKTLASALAVSFCFLALPGIAMANTFFVNTLDDEEHGEFACVEVSVECSLRDAIIQANQNEGVADVIDFEAVLGGAGAIELESELPAILDPLLINGETAEDFEDTPVIEIDAGGAEIVNGIRVDAPDTEIRALSITGASGPGIFFSSGFEGEACSNYVGVDTVGAAAPNGSGVQIGTDAGETTVGGAACGNLISGNGGNGVNVEGSDAHVANNRIGTDPSGAAPMPNTGNGVRTTLFASRTQIGGNDEGYGGNTIAFNGKAGVLVEFGNVGVAIYGNSIFGNGGRGIEIDANAPWAPPTITAAQLTPFASIAFTVTGEPNTKYEVDFYANAECDPSESGEGQSYIGFESVTTDASGVGKGTASDLFAVPPGQEVITATASSEIFEVGYATSEFSKCFPEKVVPPPPPPDQPKPPVQTLALVPENGETLAVEPVSGVIYIKLPGKGKQVKLTEGMLIPVGSVVDATKGKVTLTSVNKAGETQTAIFFGGKFLVAQRDGSGLVTLKLRGNLNCASARPSALATASAGRKGRRLWGSGKGKFRTEGNYGSATVRGTVWLTEDRCTGTFFKVRKGVVTVRDFSANETFPLGKGKSYFAQP